MTERRETEKQKRREPLAVPAFLLLQHYFRIGGRPKPSRQGEPNT